MAQHYPFQTITSKRPGQSPSATGTAQTNLAESILENFPVKGRCHWVCLIISPRYLYSACTTDLRKLFFPEKWPTPFLQQTRLLSTRPHIIISPNEPSRPNLFEQKVVPSFDIIDLCSCCVICMTDRELLSKPVAVTNLPGMGSQAAMGHQS